MIYTLILSRRITRCRVNEYLTLRRTSLCMLHQGNISSNYSNNNEAKASGLLEHIPKLLVVTSGSYTTV